MLVFRYVVGFGLYYVVTCYVYIRIFYYVVGPSLFSFSDMLLNHIFCYCVMLVLVSFVTVFCCLSCFVICCLLFS